MSSSLAMTMRAIAEPQPRCSKYTLTGYVKGKVCIVPVKWEEANGLARKAPRAWLMAKPRPGGLDAVANYWLSRQTSR